MNVSISIDFSQLKTAISQCNLQEKLELLQLLEKDERRSPQPKFCSRSILARNKSVDKF
ncbi:MAG: hypothetical protein WCP16_08350 [Pseudanabaena sp. ELA645]